MKTSSRIIIAIGIPRFTIRFSQHPFLFLSISGQSNGPLPLPEIDGLLICYQGWYYSLVSSESERAEMSHISMYLMYNLSLISFEQLLLSE